MSGDKDGFSFSRLSSGMGSLSGGGSGQIVATGVGAVVGTIAGGEIADDM